MKRTVAISIIDSFAGSIHVPPTSPFLQAAPLIFLTLCVSSNFEPFLNGTKNGDFDGTYKWALRIDDALIDGPEYQTPQTLMKHHKPSYSTSLYSTINVQSRSPDILRLPRWFAAGQGMPACLHVKQALCNLIPLINRMGNHASFLNCNDYYRSQKKESMCVGGGGEWHCFQWYQY